MLLCDIVIYISALIQNGKKRTFPDYIRRIRSLIYIDNVLVPSAVLLWITLIRKLEPKYAFLLNFTHSVALAVHALQKKKSLWNRLLYREPKFHSVLSCCISPQCLFPLSHPPLFFLFQIWTDPLVGSLDIIVLAVALRQIRSVIVFWQIWQTDQI